MNTQMNYQKNNYLIKIIITEIKGTENGVYLISQKLEKITN